MSRRNQQLFDFLVQISENVFEAATRFGEGLKDLTHPEALAATVKELEVHGDELTSGLVTVLNSTYITPLEREDFLALAVKMDDVVDGLEACTVRFDLYRITSSTPVMLEFARNILESASEVRSAIDKLNKRKLLDIRQHTQRINNLEKAGDELLRDSLRALFQNPGPNVLHVIQLKEVYEILEGITDRCQDVADVLESVIIKNA
ncbi:MAG: DUF47 family protein [Alicyclobacillus sp.]|nr:DUF47 family protein [Alicyclobacillus sp.]